MTSTLTQSQAPAPVPLPQGTGLDVSDLLAAFRSGRSARTLVAYGRDLADFGAFLGAAGIGEAASTLLGAGHGRANATALAYRDHLLGRDLAPATINRRLAALRSLVAMANTLGLVPWSLAVRNVEAQSYRDTAGPGRRAAQALVQLAGERTDAKGARDLAMLRLMLVMGLRRGDMVELDRNDVDLAQGRLRVRGKGRRERTPYTLPPNVCTALAAWLEHRGDEAGPLFTALHRDAKGERLTGTSVYRIVRKMGAKLGLTVRPHGLRHTAITLGLDLTGGDVRAVASFSRHRDLRTVAEYDDKRHDAFGRVATLLDAAL